MGVKAETSLQERIQKLIRSKGGYVIKTWGNMTTEPGRPDLICCYKGLFVAFEVKVDDNKPSPQQGIHCRMIQKAHGINAIVKDTSTVVCVLQLIDIALKQFGPYPDYILDAIREFGIDTGEEY